MATLHEALERKPDEMRPMERMFYKQALSEFQALLVAVARSKKEIEALIDEELEGEFGDFS